MSVKGIRVVLVHDAGQRPEGWISLLTGLCDGTEPILLAAADADEGTLRDLNPHRIVAVAPMDIAIYPVLMESIPILAGVEAMESFVKAFGGCMIPVSAEPDHYLMHDGVGVWTGFTEPLEVQGYPSFALDQNELPPELVVTAWNDERVALALSHRLLPLVALNFHPDDLDEQHGRNLLYAFLEGRYLTGAPMGPPEI
jgi:anthranilate/para-aminobenzoate synthase component II